MNQFTCEVRRNDFRYKRSLYVHERRIHGITRAIEETIKCPGCETKLVNMKDLLHHVREEHSSAMETYDKTFSSTAGGCNHYFLSVFEKFRPAHCQINSNLAFHYYVHGTYRYLLLQNLNHGWKMNRKSRIACLHA